MALLDVQNFTHQIGEIKLLLDFAQVSPAPFPLTQKPKIMFRFLLPV